MEDLTLKYNNILTPEELFTFMEDNIKYGIHGTNNEDYIPHDEKTNGIFQNACLNYYRLADPKYLLKHKLGHCWDQVELERDWFTKHKYNFKTIFIWFLFDYENSYSTHTTLIYQDKQTNDYCLFEHADFENKGIHHFKTYQDAIKWEYDKHIEYNKKQGNPINEEILKHIHIYEYEHPKYGSTFMDFIDNIFNAKEITNIIEGED